MAVRAGEGLRKAFRRVSAEEIAQGARGPERPRGGPRQGDPRGAAGLSSACARWRGSPSRRSARTSPPRTADGGTPGGCFPARATRRCCCRPSTSSIADCGGKVPGRQRRAAPVADRASGANGAARSERPGAKGSRHARRGGAGGRDARLAEQHAHACCRDSTGPGAAPAQAGRRRKRRGMPHALHSWRKRVKDQAAQLRLFRRVVPTGFATRIGTTRRRPANCSATSTISGFSAERLGDDDAPAGSCATPRRPARKRSRSAASTLRRRSVQERRGFLARRSAKAFADALSATAWDKASKRKASKTRGKRAAHGTALHEYALLLQRGEDAVPRLRRRIFAKRRDPLGVNVVDRVRATAGRSCAPLSAASAAFAKSPDR